MSGVGISLVSLIKPELAKESYPRRLKALQESPIPRPGTANKDLSPFK